MALSNKRRKDEIFMKNGSGIFDVYYSASTDNLNFQLNVLLLTRNEKWWYEVLFLFHCIKQS